MDRQMWNVVHSDGDVYEWINEGNERLSIRDRFENKEKLSLGLCNVMQEEDIDNFVARLS